MGRQKLKKFAHGQQSIWVSEFASEIVPLVIEKRYHDQLSTPVTAWLNSLYLKMYQTHVIISVPGLVAFKLRHS